MKDSSEVSKEAKRSAKLRVKSHTKLPNAINSYMIENSFGAICGGNSRTFVINENMNSLTFPTIFKSRAAAKRHLASDLTYVKMIEGYCIKLFESKSGTNQ